jgi:hypothetical protein
LHNFELLAGFELFLCLSQPKIIINTGGNGGLVGGILLKGKDFNLGILLNTYI